MSATAQVGTAGNRLTTDGPDLESAELGGSGVVFCFDEEIDEDEIDDDGDGFHVVAYDDEMVLEGDEGDDAGADDDCVEVDFDDEYRVSNGTVAYVEAGIVQDQLGNENEVGAVALDGGASSADEGETTAPDLTDFDVDETLERVTFEYDERVDSLADYTYAATDFGVHQSNGDNYVGDTIVSVGTRSVVVQFSENLSSSTDRAYSLEGAAASEETDGNDQRETPFGQVGEETDDPEIDEVERTNDSTIEFHFDEEIDEGTGDDEPDLFFAIAEDGTVYEGDDADAGDETVDVEFDDIDESADFEIVAAGVAPAAVESETGSDPNTAGLLGLDTSALAEGFTDAPDLETAEASGGVVEMTFDETVRNAAPAKFFVVNDEGDASAVTGINVSGGVSTTTATVDADTVSVAVTESLLNDAVGIVLMSGAVSDRLGNMSAPSSAGFAETSTTASVPVTTTSSTATTTPPPVAVCDRDGVIRGTEASDVLTGTGKADVICALGGDDFVRGLGGADSLYLGDGNDVGEGGGGADRIWGGAGDDVIRGGGGGDTLAGEDGSDTVNGQGGKDTCSGAEKPSKKKPAKKNKDC